MAEPNLTKKVKTERDDNDNNNSDENDDEKQPPLPNSPAPAPPSADQQPQAQQRVLAPLKDDKFDREELVEEYKTLNQFKLNMFKVEALIQTEDNKETLEELAQMKDQFTEAITGQEEKIKEKQETDYFCYSTEILREEFVGRLAKCYFEKDNKWYHAEILNVAFEEQEADIQFVGYKDVLKLHAVCVKLMAKPDPEIFQPGFACEAIYPEDGQYYPCMIDKIEDNGKYIVKFKKYNNKETVPLFYLRESKKLVAQAAKKRTFDDLTELKIPDNLKILPGDNEIEREKKRKKVKALKQAFKQARLDQEHQEKQSKWMSFNKQGVQKKLSHFQQHKHKISIFKTTDEIEGKAGAPGGASNYPVRHKMPMSDREAFADRF